MQGRFNGVDDAEIAGTSAEISTEFEANAFAARVRQSRDNITSSYQHPGCAIPTLKCVGLRKAAAEQLHDFVVVETFNRADITVRARYSEGYA